MRAVAILDIIVKEEELIKLGKGYKLPDSSIFLVYFPGREILQLEIVFSMFLNTLHSIFQCLASRPKFHTGHHLATHQSTIVYSTKLSFSCFILLANNPLRKTHWSAQTMFIV